MQIDLLIGGIGLLVLAHAGFATIQYREVLKLKDEEFVWPPFQVLVEVMVSFVICLWAGLRVPGRFLPIMPEFETDRLTQLSENLDFITFNHRGKVFPREMDKNLNIKN